MMMSEWIKTSDRQPEQSGLYLAYIPWGGYVRIVPYSAKHRKWNARDDESQAWVHCIAFLDNAVTKWHELPEWFGSFAKRTGEVQMWDNVESLITIIEEVQDNGK